jgi:hypothetical protein
MSKSNIDFPNRKTVLSHVEDSTYPEDPDYIQDQKNILRSQRHEELGKIPPWISLISSDNIIQQARYHVIAPNVRNSNHLFHPYPSHSSRGPSDPHGYDHHNHSHDHHNHSHDHHNHDLSSMYTGQFSQYNPYFDYLSQWGHLKENYKTRIYTHYLNIDSRNRNTTPSLTREAEILLESDPAFFSSDINANGSKVNLLTLKTPNHDFDVNNKITLTGVTDNSPYLIKALYQSNGKTAFSVIFENGKRTLAIKTDYSTSVLWNAISNSYYEEQSPETSSMSFDPNFVANNIPYSKLKNYQTSDMYVNLAGFNSRTGYIGNIPTSFLNSTHRIYFTSPDQSEDVYINKADINGNIEKITGFYILLPTVFNSTTNPPLTDTNMTISINFNYIGGIPKNLLNADLPVSQNNVYGYFTVYSITDDTISIKLNKEPYFDKEFGGSEVYVSKVISISNEFPNPNDYIIDLPNTITNVFMAKLISTTVPNTEKTFKTGINDKLYWQNLEDGTMYTNSIQIPEGSYSADELSLLLQNKMSLVTRPWLPAVPINPNGGYTNKMKFDVKLDLGTNTSTFIGYKEAIVRQPIQNVTDGNNNAVTLLSVPPYTLQIRQPGHFLNIGDKVIFSGFIDTMGISMQNLNTEHIVNTVIDNDNYEIVIDNVNLLPVIADTKGGFSAKVYVPLVFRLLFDKNDTIGKQLGFRETGKDTSITPYNTIITNNDPYQNEIVTIDNETGEKKIFNGINSTTLLKGNSIELEPDNYILMTIKEFPEGSTNVGRDKNVLTFFAKIHFTEEGNSTNSFTSTPVLFYDMLTLKKLSIQFYDSNERLYDFYGKDHSFVLELSSLQLLPQETGIESTGNFA